MSKGAFQSLEKKNVNKDTEILIPIVNIFHVQAVYC